MNQLEATVYSLRDKLDLSLAPFVSKEDKAAISAMLTTFEVKMCF